jgi:hypothetical protein
MNSHSVVLSNTYSLAEYPNNNGCEFTNELRLPLDFRAPNETWLVTMSEMIYSSDYWANIRKSFNGVQIRISNLTRHFVNNAWLWMREIYVKPRRGSKFKTNAVGLIPVQIKCYKVEYVGGVVESVAYTTKNYACNGYKVDHKDIYGFEIVWPEPTAEGWYRYTSTYGILMITSEDFAKIAAMVMLKTENIRFRLDRTLEEVKLVDTDRTIDLPPQWLISRIGLAEARLQYSKWLSNTLSKEEDFQFAFPSESTYKSPRIQSTFEMPEKFYDTNKEFIETFTRLASERVELMLIKCMATSASFRSDKAYMSAYLWKVTQRLRIISRMEWPTEVHVKLHPTMNEILGYGDQVINKSGEINATTWADGFTYPSRDMDLSRGKVTSLWVYCDIVRPSLVRDSTRPLLRCLPIDRSSNHVSYEVGALHYKFLTSNYIPRIKCWLSEDHMARPMHAIQGITYIRLEFAKQQQQQ